MFVRTGRSTTFTTAQKTRFLGTTYYAYLFLVGPMKDLPSFLKNAYRPYKIFQFLFGGEKMP